MKTPLKIAATIAAFLFCINTNAQNVDKAYTEKVRTYASIFHKNFSSGNFDKNGALVNEKIYVNSNNVIVIGREHFVNRVKRFSIPFPKLALRDRIVIVDENQVALLYIMQGTQDGPYGPIPASGNKINVYATEFFTMDDNAKMKELLTITQLDQLVKQIRGVDKINDYEPVTLFPIKKTTPEYKKIVKDNLEAFVQNFNSRDWKKLATQFADKVQININGKKIASTQAFFDELKDRIKLLPDITYHLDRNIAEGNRGAIAYTVNGTYTIADKMDEHGKPVSKAIQSKEGIHFQFNNNGKIISVVMIYNSDDINNQLK